MNAFDRTPLYTTLTRLCAAVLLGLLLIPILALFFSVSPHNIAQGLQHPLFAPALLLTLKTSLISLLITLTTGLPLSWWLAFSNTTQSKIVSILIDLPIVIPPAVVGVALLQTFGRTGLLAPLLSRADLSLPFTTTAVVIAQTIISAPFFVQAATNAFRAVDPHILLAARSLGASPHQAFFRIALPIALPGLLAATALSWARALGEFGATLLFAGNMPHITQTLPLAIFSALEADLQLAVVFSIALVALGALLFAGLQAAASRT